MMKCHIARHYGHEVLSLLFQTTFRERSTLTEVSGNCLVERVNLS